MRLDCEHRIPMEADAFWERIHSAEYEARVARALGLAEYREVERREDEGDVYRRIHVTPSLPAALGALFARIGGSATPSYVEEQWRSRSERIVRWRMTPNVLPDRSRLEGTVRVVPAGARACRRILAGTVEVRILGLGAVLERAVVAQVIDAYGASARVAADWARELRQGSRPRREEHESR